MAYMVDCLFALWWYLEPIRTGGIPPAFGPKRMGGTPPSGGIPRSVCFLVLVFYSATDEGLIPRFDMVSIRAVVLLPLCLEWWVAL